MLDEGLPSERGLCAPLDAYSLERRQDCLIQIIAGKSKAARRVLPVTLRVYEVLLARHEAAGRPDDG